MKKVIKFTSIFGFVFLAAGFISSLFFNNLSLTERLNSAVILMCTAGYAGIQVPKVPGIICSVSGLFAFLFFSAAIILCILQWIIRMSAKEIGNAKTKSS